MQKHRIIEKEYIALTDEIMQYVKEKKLAPKDFVVSGMKIGTTSIQEIKRSSLSCEVQLSCNYVKS